jgi:perosamine synthetase
VADRPRIEWWQPVMGEREKAAVSEVIDRCYPNDGPVTTEFERAVAALCGVPYAVATTSGTAALFLALKACGVGPGDEVLVPDITFAATANAVSLTGATPVLVDVDRESFCLDLGAAEGALTPRTRAVVPVHISGRGAEMKGFSDLARRHGLSLVEDAAQALGSRAEGRALGSIGDGGCFSFTANKAITTGQGGMLITSNADIHARLRELKDHGRAQRGTGGGDDDHPALGFNFKFTDLQAAVGLAQLEDLSRRQERLRETYSIYRQQLAGHPHIRLPGFDVERGECPLWVDADVDDRSGLIKHLEASGIPTRPFWRPLHMLAPYKTDGAGLERSVEVGKRALWLPTALTLSAEDVRFVCERINAWRGEA